MLLMCAWRTANCSLPNDDKLLCRFARMSPKEWATNKELILSFWFLNEAGEYQQKRLIDERSWANDKRDKAITAGKASALKRNKRHSADVPTRSQLDFNHPLPKPNTHKKSNTNVLPEKVIPLPLWLPAIEWEAYKQMRLKIKKPMTSHAEQLAIKKLERFQQNGHDPAEILNQSILNNWQDIYEPKEKNNVQTHTTSKPSIQSEARRLIEKYEREALEAESGDDEPDRADLFNPEGLQQIR